MAYLWVNIERERVAVYKNVVNVFYKSHARTKRELVISLNITRPVSAEKVSPVLAREENTLNSCFGDAPAVV